MKQTFPARFLRSPVNSVLGEGFCYSRAEAGRAACSLSCCFHGKPRLKPMYPSLPPSVFPSFFPFLLFPPSFLKFFFFFFLLRVDYVSDPGLAISSDRMADFPLIDQMPIVCQAPCQAMRHTGKSDSPLSQEPSCLAEETET